MVGGSGWVVGHVGWAGQVGLVGQVGWVGQVGRVGQVGSVGGWVGQVALCMIGRHDVCIVETGSLQ